VFCAGKDSLEPFYISSKLVTNRDYITYLCWLESVYIDYPEQLMYAFPSIEKIRLNMEQIISVKTLAENAAEREKKYLFNPVYADYPVVGVTYHQANGFCRWLTDRYNEYVLINVKYLGFDPNQIDDNSFNSEAFLAKQYEGYQVKPFAWDEKASFMDFIWEKQLFIPAFRLPSRMEWEQASKLCKPNDGASFEFLKVWNYFNIIDHQYAFLRNSENANGEKLDFVIKEFKPETVYPQLFLDLPLNEKYSSIKTIYQAFNYSELSETAMLEMNKDSLGRMPFLIIATDSKNKPILMKQKSKKQLEFIPEKPSVFRVVVCARKRK